MNTENKPNVTDEQLEKDIFTDLETLYKEVNVGKNIAEVRRALGISQEYVASQLGVCQQTVSRIEANPKINKKYFEKIADILGKTTNEILNWDLSKVIENTQYNYEGSNGKLFTEGSADKSTTNSLDVIKYIVGENDKLHTKLLKEKDEVIKNLKLDNNSLKAEIKQLRAEINKFK